MKDKIISALAKIEKKEKVKIIYTVESGSRGWGFASNDSDFDVRFIYIRNPHWYLCLERGKEELEYPKLGVLDIVGWDILKALKLFKKSNPPLIEWLYSPIIYLERGTAIKEMRKLLPELYSPKSCLYHYLSMAKRTYIVYLKSRIVKIKKYFYALRPILACMWIEKQKSVPPIEFEKLLQSQSLDKELVVTINLLFREKRRGDELGIAKKIEIIDSFINDKIKYYEGYVKKLKTDINTKNDILDNLFRRILKEYWSYKY